MKKSRNSSKNTPKDANLSRRDFIKVAGVFAGSAALAACTPQGSRPTTPPPSTPTQIPEPSPTSEPQFPVEIQAKLAGTNFTLNANGEIEVKDTESENGKTVIKGIKVNQDGSAEVSYQGKNPEVNNEKYTIPSSDFAKNWTVTEKGILTVIDKDGVIWSLDPTTKSLFPETTKKLDLNKPNREIPMETMFNGDLMSHFLAIENKARTCSPTGNEVPLLPNEIILLNDDSHDGIFLPFKLDPAKGPSGVKRQKREKNEMPVQIAAIYDFTDNNTGLKGQVIIERWSNNDGSLSYRMAISPERNTPLALFLTEVGYLTNNRFPSGLILSNTDGLTYFSNNANLKNPEIFMNTMAGHLKDLDPGGTYKTLKETGIFSNENGVPIVITGGSVIL